MLFSIIVPIYKVEDCLRRCIDSVVTQSDVDFEVILVDDGSPDGSSIIADEYASKYAYIDVIHKENGGLSDARNVGISRAKGEYIILLDSDDYLLPNSLTDLASYVAVYSNMDVIYCSIVRKMSGYEDAIIAKRNLKEGTIYSGKQALREELQSGKYVAMAQCGIYRREFLVENGLYFTTGILHEDEEWSPRVALEAVRVSFSGIQFYVYEIREGSITQSKNQKKNAYDLVWICSKLSDIYSSLGEEELKKVLLCYIGKLYSHAVSVLIRAKVKMNIEKRYVWKKWITTKDFVRFVIFAISPYIYAHSVDIIFISGKK